MQAHRSEPCMKHKSSIHRGLVYSCCVACTLCALLSLLLSTVPIPRKGLQFAGPDMPDLSSGMAAPPPTIAVIGSGLAGLVAALDASKAATTAGQDVRVMVFEKNSNLGGNSAKASSGISAVNRDAGDTQELYANDTLQSGGGLSDDKLVQQLTASSWGAVQQLEACGVTLSKVVRLGGHSAPRTRSNPAGPNVGFAIIKAVSSCLQQQPGVQVLTGAQVTALDRDASGKLRLTYTQQQGPATAQLPSTSSSSVAAGAGSPSSSSNQTLVADAVVLATGGFAASKELLQKYAPQAAALPTTNGPWATGEGLALGAALGGALTQMGEVQVHPTGFVDPADPDAGTKWLAPEKLRGCGALLLSPSGQRFVDELTTRDKVAAAIQGLPGQRCWLVLGQEGAEEFGEGTLGFYASKKMVTKCDTLQAAAAHMGVEPAVLEQELGAYAAAAEGRQADAWGKRYFPTQVSPGGPFWVAQVTPVVHYCMGGLRIDAETRVLDDQGRPVPGLFAAGEVSGGLHGKNRLGGNSLAECAVFGRVAGQQAVAYLEQLHSAQVVRVKSTAGAPGMTSATEMLAAV